MQNLKAQREQKKKIGAKSAGIVHGNISNAVTIYGEEKFNASRGHGFAAERANHLYDKLKGHNVEIAGDNNEKNGADRIVDGINIQSKYCSTGGKCISECFEDGKFRYMNPDGTPMQVEVPSDKYDAAVQSMKNHISKGEVPGVTDPEEANNIVRKGYFTYEQAKNIAKAGTVESLTYDAVNGTIIATSSFGITAVLSFATSVWNGEDIDVALKKAAANGMKVGGVTFLSAVLAGQFTKAGLNSLFVGGSEAVVSVIGARGSAVLINAFRSGTNIYGAAAMKSAAKLLRGNVITGIASVVVLSTCDVIDIFRGRISGGQLVKNIVETTGTVAGGTVGWIGGATVGATVGSAIPIIGTAVGALVGGLAGAMGGGTLAAGAANSVMDNFIEDDANEMVEIIEKEFTQITQDYLLTKEEVEQVVDYIGEKVNGKILKDMYASSNRGKYAEDIMLPFVEKLIKGREHIGELSQEDMQKGLRLFLEDVADSDEYKEIVLATEE